MRFAHNLEIRISKFENWNLRRRRLGRRLNPRAPKAFGVHGICREDFGIERNQSFKGDQGNAQFSLCCTSTAMPDDESQESTSGISFVPKNRIRKVKTQETIEALGSALAYPGYFSIRETCPAASCQRPSRLISVSVNCTIRSNGLPSAVPFTRVFPRTTAVSLP